MLQGPDKHVAECYRHASRCREFAEQALDPADKQDFLEMEHRWMRLAKRYQITERMSDFNEEVAVRISEK
jgi:hypothetical protein